MEIRKVECDHCKRDLTNTSNSIDWSIRVINRQIPVQGGYVTDMYIKRDLKHDLDFCGLGCLKKWMEKNDNQPNL